MSINSISIQIAQTLAQSVTTAIDEGDGSSVSDRADQFLPDAATRESTFAFTPKQLGDVIDAMTETFLRNTRASSLARYDIATTFRNAFHILTNEQFPKMRERIAKGETPSPKQIAQLITASLKKGYAEAHRTTQKSAALHIAPYAEILAPFVERYAARLDLVGSKDPASTPKRTQKKSPSQAAQTISPTAAAKIIVRARTRIDAMQAWILTLDGDAQQRAEENLNRATSLITETGLTSLGADEIEIADALERLGAVQILAATEAVLEIEEAFIAVRALVHKAAIDDSTLQTDRFLDRAIVAQGRARTLRDDLNDWIAARPECAEHDAALRTALDHYLRFWLNAHREDTSQRLTLIPEMREDAVALTLSAAGDERHAFNAIFRQLLAHLVISAQQRSLQSIADGIERKPETKQEGTSHPQQESDVRTRLAHRRKQLQGERGSDILTASQTASTRKTTPTSATTPPSRRRPFIPGGTQGLGSLIDEYERLIGPIDPDQFERETGSDLKRVRQYGEIRRDRLASAARWNILRRLMQGTPWETLVADAEENETLDRLILRYPPANASTAWPQQVWQARQQDRLVELARSYTPSAFLLGMNLRAMLERNPPKDADEKKWKKTVTEYAEAGLVTDFELSEYDRPPYLAKQDWELVIAHHIANDDLERISTEPRHANANAELLAIFDALWTRARRHGFELDPIDLLAGASPIIRSMRDRATANGTIDVFVPRFMAELKYENFGTPTLARLLGGLDQIPEATRLNQERGGVIRMSWMTLDRINTPLAVADISGLDDQERRHKEFDGGFMRWVDLALNITPQIQDASGRAQGRAALPAASRYRFQLTPNPAEYVVDESEGAAHDISSVLTNAGRGYYGRLLHRVDDYLNAIISLPFEVTITSIPQQGREETQTIPVETLREEVSALMSEEEENRVLLQVGSMDAELQSDLESFYAALGRRLREMLYHMPARGTAVIGDHAIPFQAVSALVRTRIAAQAGNRTTLIVDNTTAASLSNDRRNALATIRLLIPLAHREGRLAPGAESSMALLHDGIAPLWTDDIHRLDQAVQDYQRYANARPLDDAGTDLAQILRTGGAGAHVRVLPIGPMLPGGSAAWREQFPSFARKRDADHSMIDAGIEAMTEYFATSKGFTGHFWKRDLDRITSKWADYADVDAQTLRAHIVAFLPTIGVANGKPKDWIVSIDPSAPEGIARTDLANRALHIYLELFAQTPHMTTKVPIEETLLTDVINRTFAEYGAELAHRPKQRLVLRETRLLLERHNAQSSTPTMRAQVTLPRTGLGQKTDAEAMERWQRLTTHARFGIAAFARQHFHAPYATDAAIEELALRFANERLFSAGAIATETIALELVGENFLPFEAIAHRMALGMAQILDAYLTHVTEHTDAIHARAIEAIEATANDDAFFAANEAEFRETLVARHDLPAFTTLIETEANGRLAHALAGSEAPEISIETYTQERYAETVAPRYEHARAARETSATEMEQHLAAIGELHAQVMALSARYMTAIDASDMNRNIIERWSKTLEAGATALATAREKKPALMSWLDAIQAIALDLADAPHPTLERPGVMDRAVAAETSAEEIATTLDATDARVKENRQALDDRLKDIEAREEAQAIAQTAHTLTGALTTQKDMLQQAVQQATADIDAIQTDDIDAIERIIASLKKELSDEKIGHDRFDDGRSAQVVIGNTSEKLHGRLREIEAHLEKACKGEKGNLTSTLKQARTILQRIDGEDPALAAQIAAIEETLGKTETLIARITALHVQIDAFSETVAQTITAAEPKLTVADAIDLSPFRTSPRAAASPSDLVLNDEAIAGNPHFKAKQRLAPILDGGVFSYAGKAHLLSADTIKRITIWMTNGRTETLTFTDLFDTNIKLAAGTYGLRLDARSDLIEHNPDHAYARIIATLTLVIEEKGGASEILWRLASQSLGQTTNTKAQALMRNLMATLAEQKTPANAASARAALNDWAVRYRENLSQALDTATISKIFRTPETKSKAPTETPLGIESVYSSNLHAAMARHFQAQIEMPHLETVLIRSANAFTGLLIDPKTMQRRPGHSNPLQMNETTRVYDSGRGKWIRFREIMSTVGTIDLKRNVFLVDNPLTSPRNTRVMRLYTRIFSNPEFMDLGWLILQALTNNMPAPLTLSIMGLLEPITQASEEMPPPKELHDVQRTAVELYRIWTEPVEAMPEVERFDVENASATIDVFLDKVSINSELVSHKLTTEIPRNPKLRREIAMLLMLSAVTSDDYVDARTIDQEKSKQIYEFIMERFATIARAMLFGNASKRDHTFNAVLKDGKTEALYRELRPLILADRTRNIIRFKEAKQVDNAMMQRRVLFAEPSPAMIARFPELGRVPIDAILKALDLDIETGFGEFGYVLPELAPLLTILAIAEPCLPQSLRQETEKLFEQITNEAIDLSQNRKRDRSAILDGIAEQTIELYAAHREAIHDALRETDPRTGRTFAYGLFGTDAFAREEEPTWEEMRAYPLVRLLMPESAQVAPSSQKMMHSDMLQGKLTLPGVPSPTADAIRDYALAFREHVDPGFVFILLGLENAEQLPRPLADYFTQREWSRPAVPERGAPDYLARKTDTMAEIFITFQRTTFEIADILREPGVLAEMRESLSENNGHPSIALVGTGMEEPWLPLLVRPKQVVDRRLVEIIPELGAFQTLPDGYDRQDPITEAEPLLLLFDIARTHFSKRMEHDFKAIAKWIRQHLDDAAELNTPRALKRNESFMAHLIPFVQRHRDEIRGMLYTPLNSFPRATFKPYLDEGSFSLDDHLLELITGDHFPLDPQLRNALPMRADDLTEHDINTARAILGSHAWLGDAIGDDNRIALRGQIAWRLENAIASAESKPLGATLITQLADIPDEFYPAMMLPWSQALPEVHHDMFAHTLQSSGALDAEHGIVDPDRLLYEHAWILVDDHAHFFPLVNRARFDERATPLPRLIPTQEHLSLPDPADATVADIDAFFNGLLQRGERSDPIGREYAIESAVNNFQGQMKGTFFSFEPPWLKGTRKNNFLETLHPAGRKILFLEAMFCMRPGDMNKWGYTLVSEFLERLTKERIKETDIDGIVRMLYTVFCEQRRYELQEIIANPARLEEILDDVQSRPLKNRKGGGSNTPPTSSAPPTSGTPPTTPSGPGGSQASALTTDTALASGLDLIIADTNALMPVETEMMDMSADTYLYPMLTAPMTAAMIL